MQQGDQTSAATFAETILPGFFGAGPKSSDDTTGGAATGWLHTTAPVPAGGVITLRFAIWDSGDARLDSLALIDHFAWSVESTVITETKPVLPE